MTTKDFTDLEQQLENFGDQLRKRTREFEATGHFAEQQKMFLRRIGENNDSLRKRIEAAAQSHSAWEFLKAELWRDFNSAINEFRVLADRVDAEWLRKH